MEPTYVCKSIKLIACPDPVSSDLTLYSMCFESGSGSTIIVPDLGSCTLLAPGFGMGKKSGSASGMNNLVYIAESFKQFFGIKMFKI
jgi:hypothetical protein